MRLGLVILFSVSAVMVASEAAAKSKRIRKFAKQLMKVSKDRYPMLSSELAGDIEESFRDEIKFMKLADPASVNLVPANTVSGNREAPESDSFETLYLNALRISTKEKISSWFKDSGFNAKLIDKDGKSGDDLNLLETVNARIAKVQRLNFALSLVRTRWHEHVAETAKKIQGQSTAADETKKNQGQSSLVRLVKSILGKMDKYTETANLFEWTHVFDKKGVFGVGETLLLLESVALFHGNVMEPLKVSIHTDKPEEEDKNLHNLHALVVAVAQTPLSKLMESKDKFLKNIEKIIASKGDEFKNNVLLSQTKTAGLFNICP